MTYPIFHQNILQNFSFIHVNLTSMLCLHFQFSWNFTIVYSIREITKLPNLILHFPIIFFLLLLIFLIFNSFFLTFLINDQFIFLGMCLSRFSIFLRKALHMIDWIQFIQNLFCDKSGILLPKIQVFGRIRTQVAVKIVLFDPLSISIRFFSFKLQEKRSFKTPPKNMNFMIKCKVNESRDSEHMVLIFQRIRNNVDTKRNQFNSLKHITNLPLNVINSKAQLFRSIQHQQNTQIFECLVYFLIHITNIIILLYKYILYMHTISLIHCQIQSLKKKKQTILNSVKNKANRKEHIEVSVQELNNLYLQKTNLENQRIQYKNQILKIQSHLQELILVNNTINRDLSNNRHSITEVQRNIQRRCQRQNCEKKLSFLRLQLIQIQAMQQSREIQGCMKIRTMVCKFLQSFCNTNEKLTDQIDIDIAKRNLSCQFRQFIRVQNVKNSYNLSQAWENYLSVLQKIEKNISNSAQNQQACIQEQKLSFLAKETQQLSDLKLNKELIKEKQEVNNGLVSQSKIRLSQLSRIMLQIDQRIQNQEKNIQKKIRYIERRKLEQIQFQQIELKICEINFTINYLLQKIDHKKAEKMILTKQ